MYIGLTIAGSDSSGGAGIQADIKTMTMHGVYAMSAVTSLTAQNTTGVTDIFDVSPEFLKKQLDAVFSDITPDAVKIGMVSNEKLVLTIANALKRYKAKHIVVDPVMVATSGSKLIDSAAVKTLKNALFPLADVITPNLAELSALTENKIGDVDQMVTAATLLAQTYKTAVLAKGGHLKDDAVDILAMPSGAVYSFIARRVKNPNTHGTGCTLSSALASNLAKGITLKESVKLAKEFTRGAIAANLNLGKGNGPLNHMYNFFKR